MLNPCITLPKNKSERYELINNVYEKMQNISQTADTLGITTNTVKEAHQSVLNGRPDCPRMGRLIKVTKDIKYFIAISTAFYPSTSSSELSIQIRNCYGVQLSESTIDIQRHKLGFKYGPRIKSLCLNNESKRN